MTWLTWSQLRTSRNNQGDFKSELSFPDVMNEGLFKPRVMFFVLTNSPATFQTMMNAIFAKKTQARLAYDLHGQHPGAHQERHI